MPIDNLNQPQSFVINKIVLHVLNKQLTEKFFIYHQKVHDNFENQTYYLIYLNRSHNGSNCGKWKIISIFDELEMYIDLEEFFGDYGNLLNNVINEENLI